MSFRSKGLVLAMEEEGLLPVETPEVAVAEPEIVPAEVEQEIAEVQQEGGEVEDLNTAIEEAVEDAETLEDTADVLEESVAEGGEGVDEAGAEIAEIAVESLCRRLGIKKKVMPALEGFKSANSRVVSTRIALEGFKDVIGRAWAAIKSAFATLWTKITAFLDSVLNANTKLKAAAEAAKKQVEGIKGKTAPAEFENGAVATAFGFEGKASAESTLKVLNKSSEIFGDLAGAGESFEAAMKTIGELVTTFGTVAASQNQSLDVNEKLQAELTKAVNEIVNAFKGNAVVVDGAYTFGPFVGGKTIVMTLKADGGKVGASFTEGQVGKASEDKKVATLSAEDADKVLDGVLGLAAAGEKLKAKKDYVAKFEKTANETIEKAIKSAGKLEGVDKLPEGMKVAFDACKGATASFGNSYGKLSTKVPALAVQGGKLALNYVAASLKQYKEEKAAKAE
jgi:hypothetical protein